MPVAYDGSIRINTQIDNVDFEEGLEATQKGLKRLAHHAVMTFGAAGNSASKAQAQVDALTGKYNRQTDALEKQRILLDELQNKYSAISGGIKTPQSIKTMESDLKKAETEIYKLEPQYTAMIAKLKELEFAQTASGNLGDKAAADEYSTQINKLNNELMLTGERLDALNAKTKTLSSELAAVKNSPAASAEAQKLAAELGLAQKKAERLAAEADKTQEALNNITSGKSFNQSVFADRAEDGFKQITRSANRFVRRLTSIISSAVIFSGIYKGIRTLTTYMFNALKTNDQFTNSLKNIKTNLLTAFQPIYEAALPLINSLMTSLSQLTAYIAVTLNDLFGKSAETSQQSAAALYDQAKAIEETGKAAKTASKQLQSFDELNIMRSDKTDTGTKAGTSPAISTEFANTITDEVRSSMDMITAIVGGSLLALGAILLFSGVSPLIGLALMAAGATTLAAVAAVNWDTIVTAMSGTVGKITAIAGSSLLMLGALLTFMGVNIPLGIGLMAAGAASLATVAAINWNTIIDSMRGTVGIITAVVGGELLALGALLAFTGASIPLGVALMVMGAGAIATVAVINWDSIVTAMRGPTGKVTAIIGGSLLALGAVLAFSGAGLPLGISLMAAGAASLVTVAALNWNSIVEAMRGPAGKVTAIVGGSLLALGAILAFSGVGLPLGIALMLAGGAALGTAIAINWDYIPQKMREVGAKIKAGVKADINAVISVFEMMVNGVIKGLNWLITQLNKIAFDIPDWVPLIGGKKFGFNINQISTVALPRLAQGAVIPPNREFVAVLGDQKRGTNIEAPLDTIVSAVKAALSEFSGNTASVVVQIKFTGELAAVGEALAPSITVAQNANNRVAGRTLQDI